MLEEKKDGRMDTNEMPSKTNIVIRTGLTALFILALIFVPAGTFQWTEAWIFLALYAVAVAAALIRMRKKAPDLLKERMKRKKDAKRWDKIFMIIYSIFLMFLLMLPGLDAVRFGWSKVGLLVKLLAFFGYLPGFAIVYWAMRENAYLSDVVRIQEDRGHTVCTSGPYKYVRHPMYLGVILIMLCYPLSLGSLYTLIPAVIIVILFVIRTALEDKTLNEELAGYKEYVQKVRYRLFPGLW